MSKEVSISPVFNLPLTEEEQRLNEVSRFPPNPEPNWGPGTRPKVKSSVNADDEVTKKRKAS